jgi:hypothetical protein
LEIPKHRSAALRHHRSRAARVRKTLASFRVSLSRGLEGEGGSYIFMQLINYGSRKGFGKKKQRGENDCCR